MKGGDLMKNKILKTLFVGIDVSSKINVLCALDFQGGKLLNLKALNNQPGAESILDSILKCLDSNGLKYVVIALESTSFYSTHIANFLSSNELLLAYQPLVYCLNPKTVANYRKSFVEWIRLILLMPTLLLILPGVEEYLLNHGVVLSSLPCKGLLGIGFI